MKRQPPHRHVAAFSTPRDHLEACFALLDLRLRAQVRRARQVAGDDALRGLSIAEADADALLERPLGAPHWLAAPADDALEKKIAAKRDEIAHAEKHARESGVHLYLCELQAWFGLTAFDLDVLLLGLAPELDVRYERLFAYLHDDVTRRRPTVDLALGLLCGTFAEKLAERARFSPGAPLRRHGLIVLGADAATTLLSTPYRIDERVVGWLIEGSASDPHLADCARSITPPAVDHPLPPALQLALRRWTSHGPSPRGELVYLHGPRGIGRQTAALAVCHALHRRLLVVDGQALAALSDNAAAEALRPALRECFFSHSLLLWRDFPSPPGERDLRVLRPALARLLEEHAGLVLLSGDAPWHPAGALAERAFLNIDFPMPDAVARAKLWEQALGPNRSELAREASRYRLTPGQIQQVAAAARELASARRVKGNVEVEDVVETFRAHLPQPLAKLARRVRVRNEWNDLILPPEQVRQLREICDQVRYRDRVLREWGFERKLPTGRGLCLLLSGPPGTGKTFTAAIMANELGLELFQIDLAEMVSKYIGETEKHLSQVFDDAADSGAVLFFDEADALFGKRTEVRDSHDRYANIETSYLLQRIDSYEGMVVLASNFSRNLDEAFVRRMQFILEYNLPDESQRLRLWEQMWPTELPRAPDLDLPLLAKRFDLAGGNIRNIALASAFLAAAESASVAQRHILAATRREFQKLGRRVDETLFR